MKKHWLIATVVILAIGVAAFFLFRKRGPEWQELRVEQARFVLNVPASGTVQPENKITIIAPIAGRIDRIMVEEGDTVRRGQILASMSSLDRAALLDSARAGGGQVLEGWEDVYRPTSILAPASGVIIAKSIVVGQTVSQQTTLFELSDRLIVMADVDETDLGKIRLGQEATIRVDSFPGREVRAKVARIAHQSVVKNSINTYQVLLEPIDLPEEFRAGLTASIYFVHKEIENATVLPTWVAEGRENFTTELRVKEGDKFVPRQVKFGESNGELVEVLEGLVPGDTLQLRRQNVLSDDAPQAPFGVRGRRR
jgi:macrolide-specific efflux system membrane fusion protein